MILFYIFNVDFINAFFNKYHFIIIIKNARNRVA